MQRVEALVKPELLVWARESLHIPVDEVARKVHKDVVLWERGQKRPSIPQLRKLANIYKRPLAIFYLPEPPVEEDLPSDFRTLPSQRDFPLSKKTFLAIRRARRIQKVFRELASELNQRDGFDLFKTDTSEGPEILANKVRQKVGISCKFQFGWEDSRVALKEWKRAMENRGIIVLEMSMPIEEARALALHEREFPVIVINTKDSPSGRIFSLFHEVCHLMLNVSGISDLKEAGFIEKKVRRQEVFCNHFAGAFLVPADSLKEMVTSIFRDEWDDETIKMLSKKFNVSQEVILRRLLTLGLTSKEFYQKKREEFKKREDEYRKKRDGGKQDTIRDCIRDNGYKFLHLIFESLYERNITYRDAADYLRISPKYLPDLEHRFFGEIR
jgi:Zn-dependent peptidase ImmA (M78 family)/transcriptional regulator with XRE-family HTH domain